VDRPRTDALARGFRLLLLAYPRDYRRDRGEEIVDTLLEMAPPGQRRPTPRQAANLVRNGLRCQLGRPRSRGIVIAAALAAVFAAYLGASAAAWLGWQPARDLPTAAAAKAIYLTALPHQAPVTTHREDALFYYDDPTDAWTPIQGADDYTSGSIEYAFGPAAAGPDFRAFMRTVRDRLSAAGWSVGQIREHEPTTWAGARLRAEKDGLAMTIGYDDGMFTVDADNREIPIPVTLDISRATPPWVSPVAALGALLGALAGWLLVGWISRRLSGRSLVLQFSALLFGIVAYGGMLPAVALYALGWMTVASNPAFDGSTLGVLWSPLTTVLCRPPAVVAALAMLVTIGIAAVARRPRTAPGNPVGA
jgi:hypothetical protein